MGRMVLVCGWMWVAVAVSPIFAQQSNPDQPGTQQPDSGSEVPQPGMITESKLGPIYVRGENGQPVPYPALTVEEADQLLDLKRQQQRALEPPRYTLTGATITGTATDSAAELEVNFQIQLKRTSTPRNEWVRIPLRLHQSVLLPTVTHTGPGDEFLVEFDPKEGYVLWLRAPSGTDHTVQARLKVPLSRKNGARQLLLRMPDTTAKLRLTVAGNGTEATVNTGNILDQPRRVAADKTELVVDAAGGDIELSWREVEELPPVLSAFGNISVSLDGGKLEFDAQLTVRGYAAAIESFVVRLPPGAQLLAKQPGLDYIPQPDADAMRSGRRILVRRLEGKTVGPIEARFRCTTDGVVESTTPWQVGGFEVIGAHQQKGTIDFSVDGDWSIDWEHDASVRRVEDLSDILRQQKVARRFEYDRQPFSLQMRIREKMTRTTVEPTWRVTVDSSRMTLDGTLKYHIIGAREKPLELETNGWKIEQVLPAEVVAGDWRADENKLTVPLTPAVQNGGGEIALQVLATREHSISGIAAATAARAPRELLLGPVLDVPQPLFGPITILLEQFRQQSGEVTFALPRPIVEAGLPALVVVQPADNVELSPDTGQLKSLINDTLPADFKPVRQQQPFVYREDAGGALAQFVAQFRVRPQSIALAVDTRLRVAERDTEVVQQFQHTISNEPLGVLRFLIPRQLADSGQFELLVDGVSTSAWTKQIAPQFDPARVPIALEMRDPRIGSCEVVFRYRLPHERPSANAPISIPVPLIQVPSNEATTISDHRLRITGAANLAVDLLDKNWSVADGENEEFLEEAVYQSSELPGSTQVSAVINSTPSKRSTELLRVWVQSLLTASERRDRACFRLTTNEQNLLFTLPAGIDPREITVAVNGQRTGRFTLVGKNTLRVELGENLGVRETTIELWYWFEVHAVPVGRLSLQAPQLNGLPRAERAYWQLLLPSYEHLAWHDANLTSENSWHRAQLLWIRQPHRTQAELEAWVGASQQPAQLPESGFNAYLFSSVGTLEPKTLYTITRPTAVLIIGGIVLALGAALLYQPVLRHPLSLLAVGVGIVGLAVAYPEPAVAAVQLIAVGLTLVLLTGVLIAFLSRPAPKRGVVRGASQPPESRDSKTPSSRPSGASSRVTTSLQQTVPVSATGNES